MFVFFGGRRSEVAPAPSLRRPNRLNRPWPFYRRKWPPLQRRNLEELRKRNLPQRKNLRVVRAVVAAAAVVSWSSSWNLLNPFVCFFSIFVFEGLFWLILAHTRARTHKSYTETATTIQSFLFRRTLHSRKVKSPEHWNPLQLCQQNFLIRNLQPETVLLSMTEAPPPWPNSKNSHCSCQSLCYPTENFTVPSTFLRPYVSEILQNLHRIPLSSGNPELLGTESATALCCKTQKSHALLGLGGFARNSKQCTMR